MMAHRPRPRGRPARRGPGATAPDHCESGIDIL